MNYTTYRWGLILMFAVSMGLPCVVLAIISPVLAIVLAVVFAIVGVLGLRLRFALTEGAMWETGGVSTQQWFDIVDDRDPKVLEAYNRGERPRFSDGEESDSSAPNESCPYCGARVSRPSATYCDACGKPLRLAGSPTP